MTGAESAPRTLGPVNRVVVVTGANRGLGLEVARQLARRGDHVPGSRDDAVGKAAAAEVAAMATRRSPSSSTSRTTDPCADYDTGAHLTELPGDRWSGSGGEAAQALAEEHDAEDEEQHGHHRAVVRREPRLPAIEDARRRARRRPGRRSPARRCRRSPRGRRRSARPRPRSPTRPACARPAPAASESARFFGLTALQDKARPAAFTGVSESIEAIHLGCGGGPSPSWSARQFLTASTTRSTPSRA